MNLSTVDLLSALGHDHPLAVERLRLLRRMAVGAETCRAEPVAVSVDANAPVSGVYEREDADAVRARILGACREHAGVGIGRTDAEGREGEERRDGEEQHHINLTSTKRAGQL